MNLMPTPTMGYCNCGRPSASAASGWCGYCQWRDITVADKTHAEPPRKTLRDEFAMAAVTSAAQWFGNRPECARDIAREAYRLADAMMKARDQ
jgi:hypothetical protein